MLITLQSPAEAAKTKSPDVVLVIPVPKTTDFSELIPLLADRIGLPSALLDATFKAEAGEVLPVFQSGAAQPGRSRIFLLGLGEEPGPINWLRSIRKLFFEQKNRFPAHVRIDLTGQGADTVEAVILGVRGGGYDLRLYQTDKSAVPALYAETGQLTVLVADADRSEASQALARATVIADAQRAMLDLMNAPASHKNPQTLANWAMQSGRTYGYPVRVMDQAELEQLGLGALLSVSRGSEHPPVMIVAEYKTAGLAAGSGNVPVIGLVGKGVTFDTGGISIKPSASMHLMKSDMGGAAAVLGTVEVAARLGLPVHLIGIVPATENNVDGRSTKPGDVVTSYLGKTIEVIDTDAEGRVILADGLGYMVRHFQPDVVIDLATLTGSVIAALGYHAAGLFTQNDALARDLIAAADRTGERLWRLPLWDAYKEDIKSDVADLKNFSGKPVAGAISAAKFLEAFTDRHPAWAHLDIAGMAFADTEFGHQKNATGFGIRLLIDYLRSL